MLAINESTFTWRTPDERVNDEIAEYEIPQHREYKALRGNEVVLRLPAKAELDTGGTEASQNNDAGFAADGSTNDIDATMNTTAGEGSGNISVTLKYFTSPNNFVASECIEVWRKQDGSSNYYKMSYGTADNSHNWDWNDSKANELFIHKCYEKDKFRIYYVPDSAQYEIWHETSGYEVRRVRIHQSSSNEHMQYNTALSPSVITKNETLESRTYLHIYTHPKRYTDSSGNDRRDYRFDPIDPNDSGIVDLVYVELEVDR